MELLKERIQLYRSTLEQNVDVDKLYPILQQNRAITMEEISQIESLSSKPAKVGKLLDIFLTKDGAALQSFFLVLQKFYQHVLTLMFSEPAYSSNHTNQQELCSTSLTSDSEDDVSRSQISSEPRPGDFNMRSIVSKTTPPHQYDTNSTASGSFPAFSEQSDCLNHSLSSIASPPSMFTGREYTDQGYKWFFNQFEKAFSELHGLKQQNAEMIDLRDRYDQVTNELKQLRGLYKTESQCLQQANAEIQGMKAQQTEMVAEKKQLLDEVTCLQKLRSEDKQELAELRHQQRKTASETGSSDGLGEMYESVLHKYENVCKDYEMLREKYPELMASHNSVLARLGVVSEENVKLKSQLEEMRGKNETLSVERNGLKQQCTNAIREWNQMLIKHSQLKDQLGMVIRQRDDFCKDLNQTFAKHTEMKKSFEALKTEKDAAIKEYALVMSERDTVHKEIEQLHDKLSSLSKQMELVAREKEEVEGQLESLRRDMSSVLSERDKYKRERNDISGINQGLKHEFQLRMEEQRDIAWKERNEAYEQMEQIIKQTYEKTQKEKAEEIDNVTKESDILKKNLEKLKLDFENAEKEAENANRNRDKAFSERDKIVQERESIRTLCDNLRRDRDRAVSDLAQALRDSDEFKRQKNEAVKELKEIKNQYEALVEKESRQQQLHSVGHNHSRDSAIDADLQDLGSETLEIPIELHGLETGDIGFEVIGGKDDPQFPNDSNLFVSHVSKGGIADGKLRVSDTIIRINNLETANIDKRTALQALWKSPGSVSLVVKRRKSSTARIWQPVQIVMTCQKDPGIQIDQGLFISRICPGGIVAKYGVLPCIGDRIITINNVPVDSMTSRDAMRILETSTDSLVLDVWRQTSPLSSAGSSPTPISVGIGSPMHDSTSMSSSMSKSDTLAVCSSSWDASCYNNRGEYIGKNLRNSGSQTDSLDSPGPSPCKSLHIQESDKIKHSLPILDKAIVKVERILRVRHKSKDLEDKKDLMKDQHRGQQDTIKSQRKHVEDCGTQVNLSNVDDDVSEFPSNAKYMSMTGSGGGDASVTQDLRSSKICKREWELDSNSGTWPKTRVQQAQSTVGPPTVIFAPGHKPGRDRPSVRDIFYGGAESLSYEAKCGPATLGTPASGGKLQTSDSSIMNPGLAFASPPPQSSLAQTLVSPSSAPAMSQSEHSGLPKSATPSSSQKSQSHFTVGVLHSPNFNSGVVSSRGPPPPAQIYGTVPSHRHTGQRASLVSMHHSQPHPTGAPVPQDFRLDPAVRVAPRSQQMKSYRPTAIHKADPQWQPSSPLNWARDSPVGYQAMQTSVGPVNCFGGSTGMPFGSPPPASSPHYTRVNVSGSSGSPMLMNPPPYGTRPASLEVPQSVRVSDFGMYERNRISSPVGQGFLGRPAYHHHEVPAVQHPAMSSPPGTFPVISQADLENERPLSFHGAPGDRYSSPSPSQKSYTTISEEFYPTRYPRTPHSRPYFDDDVRQAAFKRDRVLERICIPSGTSIATKSGSAEIALSDRSSPGSPIFHIDSTGSIQYHRSPGSDEYMYRHKIPNPHETRDITFEKNAKPVGFKIQQGTSGGIFVSSVNDNSLAAQAGLVIGDQLLEVCGINMRNASYKHAVTVLRQCGDNLTIKVQYNPEKYTDHNDASSTTSVNSSLVTNKSSSHSNLPSGQKSTPKHQASSPSKAHSPGSGDVSPDKRRYITLKKSNPNMIGPGFSFIGGNAVGIFVHEVYYDCFVGGTSSLQRGDHILEFNSVDFRSVTAEKAMVELTRPCATMGLCVFYNFAKYTKIQTIPCDSFYIRANFERSSETEEELGFHRDDILYVENSLFKNQLGTWFAWLLNEQGTKLKGGIVPSRIRLEDELVLRRTHSESRSLHETDDIKGSRRGSASARRSFFRRRRHHHNNSKDSHDFGSFSDASLNSDSVPILDDSILGYTQVERIEPKMLRPAILLAPLAEALIKKLESESPDKYRYCQPSPMKASQATMEQSLTEGVLIDYWKEDDLYQCIRASDVKEICDSNVHCLLNVGPGAVERMQQSKVYPIIIFVRHKSAKQIRDTRDPQFLKDKASNKLAKEQFDHFQKMEQDYGHLFSAVIPGGNLAEMCMQIKTVINSEQKKAVWVTTNPV